MKYEKLSDALGEIREDFIAEASFEKKRKFPIGWISALAAVLAVAILAGSLLPRLRPEGASQLPGALPTFAPAEAHQSYLLAAPQYPVLAPYPADYAETTFEAWHNDQKALHDQPEGYADNLQSYFATVIPQLLEGAGTENITCSPLNIYLALAMLAETTGGNSRQQILELLQADSIDTLRQQAGQVWKAHYNNDGLSTSILANSLWLHDQAAYDEDTVSTLASSYYASVFRGALGTEEMNQALRSWLNENTGGLLEDQVQDVKLSPNTVLALASTILYQVQWQNEFYEKFNTEATFHGAKEDTTETFMNTTLGYGPYYWSDNFGAVNLHLEDGSRMWLLLPDEGITPAQILESGEASRFFSSEKDEKTMTVNLSVPKFDICADMDLIEKLKALGVTDIFESGKADFSPILPEDDGGWVDQVKHATRVAIDEKGVTAAAFTVIARCGAGMPPEDQIDFVLDRPFLFYIESQDGLPLFTGIVNEP